MTIHLRNRLVAILPLFSALFVVACDDDGLKTTDTGPERETSGADAGDTTSSSSDASTSTATTSDASTSGDSSSGGSDSSGSTDGSDDAGSSSSGSADALEIAGAWIDDFGGAHLIDEKSWSSTYEPTTYTYSIHSYDNDARRILAQDDSDATWTKYEWTYVSDSLYYCQSAFGLASVREAIAATPADDTDPTTSGCGGFAWSRLTPAP